ncbi:MAG: serine/threonine-protein kinase [Polyangiales bacterium]
MKRIIDGRFELVSLVADGANATVWRAIDRETLAEVALKIVRGAEASSRLPREIHALAAISHPRLPRLIASGHTPDGPYLAMSLVRATPLRTIAHRPRHQNDVRTLGLAICEPLSAIHRAGLVHRDLKPEHVLLDSTSDLSGVSLVDLGLALALDAPRDLTGDAIIGTLGYLPPEQLRSPPPAATPRWDVFSLGCVLYECATGTAPFDAPDRAQLVARMLARDVAPMREQNTTISEAMESLVLAMLSPSPDDRPRDAAEARDRLTQIQVTNQNTDVSPLDERRAIAVIVGHPIAARAIEQTTDTVTSHGAITGVSRELLPSDAFATETADGAALVVLRATAVDPALVARAVQCALLLSRALPSHRFAVSASLGTLAHRWPRGPALARALALCSVNAPPGSVLIDEHTALFAQDTFALTQSGAAFVVHPARAS